MVPEIDFLVLNPVAYKGFRIVGGTSPIPFAFLRHLKRYLLFQKMMKHSFRVI